MFHKCYLNDAQTTFPKQNSMSSFVCWTYYIVETFVLYMIDFESWLWCIFDEGVKSRVGRLPHTKVHVVAYFVWNHDSIKDNLDYIVYIELKQPVYLV